MEIFDIEKHWDDFKNNKLVVNCPTQELANEFHDYCSKQNITWFGHSIKNNYWSDESTCYRHQTSLTFADIEHYENEHYTIVEFQGLSKDKIKIEIKIPTETSKEIIKVIYHNKETIVLIKSDGRYYKGVVSCHYQDTYDKEIGFQRAYEIAREKYNEFKGCENKVITKTKNINDDDLYPINLTYGELN